MVDGEEELRGKKLRQRDQGSMRRGDLEGRHHQGHGRDDEGKSRGH